MKSATLVLLIAAVVGVAALLLPRPKTASGQTGGASKGSRGSTSETQSSGQPTPSAPTSEGGLGATLVGSLPTPTQSLAPAPSGEQYVNEGGLLYLAPTPPPPKGELVAGLYLDKTKAGTKGQVEGDIAAYQQMISDAQSRVTWAQAVLNDPTQLQARINGDTPTPPTVLKYNLDIVGDFQAYVQDYQQRQAPWKTAMAQLQAWLARNPDSL